MDPVTVLLLIGGFALLEFVLLIMMITKTPALTFLFASFTKRIILIHPRENHYVNFVAAKPFGCLAGVKNRGLYIINPKHVYVESSSKLPCAIIFGNFALTLDMRVAACVTRLKELGIVAGDQLIAELTKIADAKQRLIITLLGESVDAADLMAFFRTSERSDLVEAEIQRRQANAILAKLKTPGDLFKWAVILVIIMIGAAIAWGMFTTVTAPAGGSNAGLAKDIAAQVAAQTVTPPPVVGNTGAGGGMVIT